MILKIYIILDGLCNNGSNMKIAIINSNAAIAAGGGVRIQGIMWRDGLVQLGHRCDLIDFWKENDWKSYDWIIVLGYGGVYRAMLKQLAPINPNIAIAPILDPSSNKYFYKFLIKYFGCHKKLGLTTRFHDLYLGIKYGKAFLTRSNQETEYLSFCCDIPQKRIIQIPLPMRFEALSELPPKENFCFHCSRLESPNKNVSRLVEAAKKYKFELKLAGFLNGEKGQEWIKEQISDYPNIEYLGAISDETLIEYYKRCKVFALPSLFEGVGMVALEAAGFGAEIVLTNVGAPKEYWNGMAELVNPYSVDEIGKAVLKCMQGKSQPQLLKFIKENYSMQSCMLKLVDALKNFR